MNKIKGLPPFKRFCVTIGNLPSSYVDSMSYYECIMWLCKYLEDTVIPTVNENAEAVNELINWFNNLDVQDEINTKLDEMAESGELEEIVGEYLFYFWVSPKSYGAVLDGETDDTEAIAEALTHGNVKFPSNSVVKLTDLDVPNYRIIDFNNSTIKSDSTPIKIGSLSNTSYKKKITIKNGYFDIGTNAIELIQAIFVDIDNCYLPSLKNGNKFISMTNCFNVYVNKCSVGDYTPDYVANTKGIYITDVSGAAIEGTANTTNVRISNTLIQRVEYGIDLNVSSGLIDTTYIDNCGFSDNEVCINIPNSYVRNTVINCIRSEFSRLILNNYGRVNLSGLEAYNNTKVITNRGQLYLNGNIDLRGTGEGIDSTTNLFIAVPISCDSEITHSITYAQKPYNVYPVDCDTTPNEYIDPLINYQINQTGDFNLADLTTSGIPIGSELILNTQNGFTITGYNCKYVIPERGSVRLKKLSNWCVESLGAKVGSAPTPATSVTLTSSKVRIVGDLVIVNYDITVSAKIDNAGVNILTGLPAPTSSGNYVEIGGASCNINTSGELKTHYNGDLNAGTYRGEFIYTL